MLENTVEVSMTSNLRTDMDALKKRVINVLDLVKGKENSYYGSKPESPLKQNEGIIGDGFFPYMRESINFVSTKLDQIENIISKF